ncbi:hypothetical protein PR048_015503 [Dryococelus australis]|uniref:Reverse transcriptase n=1 Tax=Dryococelus australis TaxID=614101 RepID=A0ABQ9HH52_9NEOP|nr:hypothetical protein PR048_015503 [Dryococelus australis]
MEVSMASSNIRSYSRGECSVTFIVQGYVYAPIVFNILSNLCADVVTGHGQFLLNLDDTRNQKENSHKLKRKKLLTEGIIEDSYSPWRAQALVVEFENHNKRMFVDYSQTINPCTYLDAYQLTRIEYVVNKQTLKARTFVDDIALLEGNLEYAHIRLTDGRDTTISTRHLAHE